MFTHASLERVPVKQLQWLSVSDGWRTKCHATLHLSRLVKNSVLKPQLIATEIRFPQIPPVVHMAKHIQVRCQTNTWNHARALGDVRTLHQESVTRRSSSQKQANFCEIVTDLSVWQAWKRLWWHAPASPGFCSRRSAQQLARSSGSQRGHSTASTQQASHCPWQELFNWNPV